MVTLKTVKHKDVRGNELLYIIASNGSTDVIINVGQKTFDAISALTQEPKHSTIAGQASDQKPKKEVTTASR